MSELSKIQWTEATWNPWHGCKKVSAGCKFCYMYRDKEKYGQDPTVVVRSKTKFEDPLKWKEPKVIFTCSWSDWFIDEADLWRSHAWKIIKQTPHHTYQILTKRSERIKDHLPDDWGSGYQNVWLGVSIENQEVVRDRLYDLLEVPAQIKFISAEPLLSKIDFDLEWGAYQHGNNSPFRKKVLEGIDWIIVGGESGNDNGQYKYRPCQLDWIANIINQCKAAEVPVFVKQLGTYLSKLAGLKDRHGGNIDEWPEGLQIREFPETVLHDTKLIRDEL